ncbi:uncharacterized protein LOC109835313 [Asparagus officinalis]|uniref:uncharacterized protein LOC109835313 n=1 Tax=Asparagus officinalis TaxID=4686 RepID=UPI00098E0721|nr:uncharacterized protein LOC109835313 [Asparagus officinalis]
MKLELCSSSQLNPCLHSLSILPILSITISLKFVSGSSWPESSPKEPIEDSVPHTALEAAMRPTQVRTHAIRRAHENIDKTLKSAKVILGQFDLTRQAESKILKGPHEDLESYLEAIDQLRANVRFFNSNKSLKSSDGLLNHANNNVRFFNSNKSLKSSDGLLNHANNMLMLEFISDGNSQQQTYFLHT